MIKTNNHSAYSLYAHIVFVVKYRRRLLTSEVLDSLEKILLNQLDDLKCRLVEFNGETDHVHLLLEYNPTDTLSVLCQKLKGRSSFELRRFYPRLLKTHYLASLWTSGYFVSSCGGVTIDKIRKYIENQNRPIHPLV